MYQRVVLLMKYTWNTS